MLFAKDTEIKPGSLVACIYRRGSQHQAQDQAPPQQESSQVLATSQGTATQSEDQHNAPESSKAATEPEDETAATATQPLQLLASKLTINNFYAITLSERENELLRFQDGQNIHGRPDGQEQRKKRRTV